MSAELATASAVNAPQHERRELANAIVATLRERGIPFAVLNGIDPSSRDVGHDVDLLVRRRDVSASAAIARDVARQLAWMYVAERWPGRWMPAGLYQLAFHRTDGSTFRNLTLDLVCSEGLAAGVIPVYSPRLLDSDLDRRKVLPVSPVASYAKTVLIRALAGSSKGFAAAHEAGPMTVAMQRHLWELVGRSFVEQFERAVQRRSLVCEWRSLRRRAQLAYFARHPIGFVRRGFIAAARKVLGDRSARIPRLAVTGPDGVGKSTAIETAQAWLQGAFVDVQRRHWRPHLLPPLSRLRGTRNRATEASASPPRRTAGAFAPVRLAYYWLDYVLGYWLRDRHSSGPHVPVILYDRCALDMHVHPERFGLTRHARNLLPHRFAPGFDRVIVLLDDPASVRRRKAELSIEEIEAQSRLWEELHSRGDVHAIIRIEGRTAESIGREIAEAALKVLSNFPAADARNAPGTLPVVTHTSKAPKNSPLSRAEA